MEVSGQHHVPLALPPGQNLVPIEWVAGWAPEPVWTFWRTEKSLVSCQDSHHGSSSP